MTPGNQKKILDTMSRVFSDVATALGQESCDYEKGICSLRDYGNKTLFELLFTFVVKTMPEMGQKQTLTPEMVPFLLDAMNTRERAAAVLAEIPDPDSAELETYLREVVLFLPSVRKVLVPFAKQLPPDPGGHPRIVPKKEEPMVRAEVAQLFNDGYSFPDAKKEVARRRHASVSTIQRICRRGTTQLGESDSDKRD